MDFAPEQWKSQQDNINLSHGAKFGMYINFVIAPHNKGTPQNKQFCHVEQDCFSGEAFCL